MPPALSNKALATVLSVAASLAWAGPGPNVSGPYLGEAYGQVDFRMDGEKVVGTAAGTGGACGFTAGTPVITGVLQGHVLVGRVLVCQAGLGCEPRQAYPAFIVINTHDRVLSALIRLPAGCTSPALKKDVQLFLKAPAPQDEAREADAEPEAEPVPAPGAGAEVARAPAALPLAAPPTAEGAGSAVVIAQARQREPEVPPLEAAQRQLTAGNAAAAQTLFEHVLETDPRNPAALVGLAACQLRLGNVGRAVKTLEPAAKASNRPDLHLWLAYAYSVDKNRPRALASLRRAMDLGWAPGNRPAEAVPETALRTDIEALSQQRSRKRASSRETTGPGSTNP